MDPSRTICRPLMTATMSRPTLLRQLHERTGGRMRRRKFISLFAGIVVVSWPRGVKAQGVARRPMVAVLVPGSQESSQEYVNVFLQVLREQGRIDGQTIDIKYRYADGDASRHPALAEELVRLNPDVIVAGSTTPALACKQATATIPIVSAVLTDAINLGLITSYRPARRERNWNHGPGRHARKTVAAPTRIGAGPHPNWFDCHRQRESQWHVTAECRGRGSSHGCHTCSR